MSSYVRNRSILAWDDDLDLGIVTEQEDAITKELAKLGQGYKTYRHGHGGTIKLFSAVLLHWRLKTEC